MGSWFLALTLLLNGFANLSDFSSADVPALLINGTFEADTGGWRILKSPPWHSFSIAGEDGNRFLRLVVPRVRSTKPHISGAVQDVAMTSFPRLLTFRMRIADHDPTAGRTYAQAVISVWPDDDVRDNRQVRYILCCVEEPPYTMTNAAFVMVFTENIQGGWGEVVLSVGENMTARHGHILKLWEGRKLTARVFLEARCDAEPSENAGEGPLLDVHFDDVKLVR